MNEGFDIQQQLSRIGLSLLESVTTAVPRVITAVILLIVALIVLKLIEKAVRGVLVRVQFDRLLERIGLDKMIAKAGIGQPASQFIPRVVYWLLLFLFAQSAAESMNIKPISEAIGGFLAYLPNLFSALVVMIVGSLLGKWAGTMISRSATESGIEFGKTLGSMLSGVILFVAVIMAVAQLRIDTQIVRLVSVCVMGGVALAFGLSFGLGTRQFTRDMIAGFYAKKLFQSGDSVEIRGQKGVVRDITPVQILIESDGRTLLYANSVFLDEAAKI